MAIISYIQGLGARHLFTFNNVGTLTTDDRGNSATPTNIKANLANNQYSFELDPVCEGFTYSLDVLASTDPKKIGATFQSVPDINSASGWNNNSYSAILWFKQGAIQNPTCIYEQGGGTNNLTFMGGALTTWQAADSGQPFLIAIGKSLAQAGRPYFLTGIWEYHTEHAGSGNRVTLYINGVLQGVVESTGTQVFPSHTGDINAGNSDEPLRSFADTTQISQTTAKNENLFGLFASVTLTQAQAREIFERTTFADVTISADTVANQQIALDALSGNTYENMNCAIRVLQATDATNYRLFIDNITFNADPNLEDISIQFVGTGILTVEDTNGTVIAYTSAPAEVETTAATYTGGGSVVVVTNTIRHTANATITGSNASKLVFDGAGTTYTVDGGTITEIENVSGLNVTVTLSNGTATPTLTETSGAITLLAVRAVSVAGLVAGSRLQIYNVTTNTEIANEIVTGTTYSATYSEGEEYSSGDTARVRATYVSTILAMKEFEANAIAGANGWSVLVAQESDPVYDGYGIDGSSLTAYAADYVDTEVDISVPANFSIKDLYAWWAYNLTTSQGIAEFMGGITAETASVIRVNTAIVNIFLDNVTTNYIFQNDDLRFYRDDGAYPVKIPTTGGGCIDVEWRTNVSLAQAPEVSAINAKVDALASSQTIINDGVKKASLLIPHGTNL